MKAPASATLEHTLLTGSSQGDAWAMGDVATLRSAVQQGPDPCWNGFGDSAFAKELGVENIEASVNDAWLTAASKALADNQQSFAVLELDDVIDPNGLLSKLASRGYTVLAPSEK